jgi:uncharacterized membrane protein YwzB
MATITLSQVALITAVVAVVAIAGSWFGLRLHRSDEFGRMNRKTRLVIFGVVAMVNIMGLLVTGFAAQMFE